MKWKIWGEKLTTIFIKTNDETKRIFFSIVFDHNIVISYYSLAKTKTFLQNLLQNVKLNCIHYIKRLKLK